MILVRPRTRERSVPTEFFGGEEASQYRTRRGGFDIEASLFPHDFHGRRTFHSPGQLEEDAPVVEADHVADRRAVAADVDRSLPAALDAKDGVDQGGGPPVEREAASPALAVRK